MDVIEERYCEGNFDEIQQMIRILVKEKGLPVTPNIEGDSGLGKTACAKGLADSKTFTLFVSPASEITEPGDLAGLPERVEGVTVFNPVKFAVMANERAADYALVLLLMDDFNRVPSQIQQAFMPMFYERRVGSYPLKDNVFIILTSNPGNSDRYATRDLDQAQQERIQTFRLVYDHKVFTRYAMKNQWVPEWVAFLNEYPEMLGGGGRGISPRTAEYCNQALRNFLDHKFALRDPLTLKRIDAVVGRSVRTSFVTCIDLQDSIIKPEDLIEGKYKQSQFETITKGRPDLLGLTHSRLATYLHKRLNDGETVTSKELTNIQKFMLGHGNDEMTLVFLRACPKELQNDVLSVDAFLEIKKRVHE